MKNKKGLALLIVMFMLINPIFSFAATVFSDVASNHWAKDFISKMSEKGIIRGFEDTKTLRFNFKPENPVTYVESIQMIYQTLKSVNKLKSTTGLVTKHQTTLTSAKIPTWAHEAMAYAIEYNIVHKDEVTKFIKNNAQVNAKRVDVAVFLGKAIDMDDAIDPLPILGFMDAEMIIKVAVPYVDLLVKKQIINGDNNNRFNPNNAIKRAEMATICSKTYDLLNQNTGTTTPVIPTPTQPTTPKQDIKTIEYIIEETNTIVVKNEEGQREVYGLPKNTYIKINGKTSRLETLKIGQKIVFVFDSKDVVTEIITINSISEFEGIIEKITDYIDYYLITVKDYDRPTIKKDFKVYSNAEILLNDKKVAFSRLRSGDTVYLTIDGETAKKIEIEASNAVYDGILESNVYFNPYPMIKVKVRNNEVIELELDEDVEVTRNSRSKGTEDLIKGDVISVTVKRGKATHIIATSVDTKRKDEGTIKTLAFANPSKITIVTSDNEETEYDLANSVDVEIDDKDAEIYDLRPNYYVKLSLTNGIVTSIDAESSKSTNSIVGEVVKVYMDYNILTVKFLNSATATHETKTITVNDSTKIISTTGTTLRLGHLSAKDKVFIDGNEIDDLFVANRIIMLD